ncbi:MAG: S8 family serine peptidase [Candidatus Bathyarchaeota archaeon]|nr:S8 family serine peptidase [Candidatus Bathyarchaeota archaeon]
MIHIQYMHFNRGNFKGIWLLSVLIVSTFAFVAPATVTYVNNAVAPAAVQKLTQSVIESLQASTLEQMNVIVHAEDNAQVIAQIEELGGQVSQTYQSVEALAASIPTSKILELASNPSVIRIYDDRIQQIYYSGNIFEELKPNISIDPVTNTPVLEEEFADVEVEPLTIDEIVAIEPSIYTNAYLTNADDVWSETNYGSGSTVVIIDTGVWSASPMLVGNVIGGIDISPDVGTPYEGYNLPTNHYHGTACAHLLAAHATLRFRPNHPWGEAIYKYDPEGTWRDASGYVSVTCMGIAPAASIYAIKTFPHTGAGVSSSIIMKGIDIAIQMKLNGTLDVDVISMSLGGPVAADGYDPEDLLVDAATAAGITVVAAAGNEGPAPLRVSRPASAKTSIAVGAAMDPIHEWVLGDIYFSTYYGAPPGNGLGQVLWYPHNEMSIAYFSSRGPSADGRVKPEVVATGSGCFLGLFPGGTIRIGGGTSFACPQVAGEAALLNAYIEMNGLSIGPLEIKQAIYDGAEPIPGFTALEQGAGYINVANSLEVIKSRSFGTIPKPWPNHFCGIWFPPIEMTYLCQGTKTIYDVTLEPAKYKYFAFWVTSEVDSIKITLSDVQLADPALQNPFFGDAGIIYLSNSHRGGSRDYFFRGLYFNGDGQILITSDMPFEPGVLRLVLAGDYSSYNPVVVGKLTIEVTEVWVGGVDRVVTMYNRGAPVEAMVEVYPGKIQGFCGSVKTGGTDTYTFSIPDASGFAFVFLYWYSDWAHFPTSDLDLIIINPDGTLNFEGATMASPEVTTISGPGTYTLLVDGYEIYFDRIEYYYLEIVYFSDGVPIWSSPTFKLDCFKTVKSPVYGVAVVWLRDIDFDTWYIGGFAYLSKKPCKPICTDFH